MNLLIVKITMCLHFNKSNFCNKINGSNKYIFPLIIIIIIMNLNLFLRYSSVILLIRKTIESTCFLSQFSLFPTVPEGHIVAPPPAPRLAQHTSSRQSANMALLAAVRAPSSGPVPLRVRFPRSS